MANISFTPAERLKTALNHKEPDKIPLDLGSTNITGININAYNSYLDLKGWRTMDESPKILDTIQQLADVPESVLTKLGVDSRGLFTCSPAGFKPKCTEDERYTAFTDNWGITWQMPRENGRYYDMCAHPLAGDIDISDLKKFPWPDPLDESIFAAIPSRITDLERQGDYGLILNGFTSGILEMGLRLRGFEQFFMDLYINPVLVETMLDKLLELKCAYWEKALELIGDKVQVAVEADDLGTQNSQLISPETYRKILKPRHKELISVIKKKAPHIKVFFHSCGAVRPLIPDFIEAGIDILNPIQVAAKDMETKALKKDFGDCITFWGGAVDTQKTLPLGTPEEVKNEVMKRIENLAPSGGFIFNAIHNIQADVPPENIEAMLEALNMYSIY
ncbi:MAG: uroporphyrinogen decarboxylase family protein [Eubacteriales bacterium]